jgi:hypothetical protein
VCHLFRFLSFQPLSLAVAIGAHFPSRVLSSFLADVCLVGLTRVLAFSKYYFPRIALNRLLKMLLLLALRCLSPRSLFRETLELFALLLVISLDVFCVCTTLGWVGFQDLLARRFYWRVICVFILNKLEPLRL